MVAGVLLTGGQSRRLGVDKARVELDGEAFAERGARALAAVCDPCIEVGSGASALRCIRESPPGEGPLAGVIAGVRALDVDSIVVLACDMPRVTPDLLRLVADRPRHTVVPIARQRAQYGCAKYGGDVLRIMCDAYARGERSFRWLVDHDVDWIDESVWGGVVDEIAFRDVDTREDARELGIALP